MAGGVRAETVSKLNDLPLASLLQFYATAPYPCSYLPEKSGALASRHSQPPHRHAVCTASWYALAFGVAAPSPTDLLRPLPRVRAWCASRSTDFVPSRSQKARDASSRHCLTAVGRELAYDSQTLRVYLRYQRYRHPGGGMDQDSREQHHHFLLHSSVPAHLYEFREGGVAARWSAARPIWWTDSRSVYTFFEPDNPGASYGTLQHPSWQIERCSELGLPHLYPLATGSRRAKMAYKATFRPIEGLVGGVASFVSCPSRAAKFGKHASDCRFWRNIRSVIPR